jgi:hypothetical protein
MPARTTSTKALASVALAALTVGLWAFADVPPLAVLPLGVACIALAVLASRDIRRSDGTLAGRWLAVAAIWSELAAMVCFVLLLPAVQKVRENARRMVSA